MDATFAKVVRSAMTRAYAWGLVIAAVSIGSAANAAPPKPATQPVAASAPEKDPSAPKPTEPAPKPETAKPDAAPAATETAKPDAAPAATETAKPDAVATKAAEAVPKPETAKPDAAPAATEPVKTEPPRSGSTVKTVGYVIECVGLGAIIVGAVMKSLSSAKFDTIGEHCDANRACDRTGMDAVSSARTFQNVGFASLIGGLAAVGTGIALVVTSPGSGEPKASMQPTVLHGGAGVSVGGRF
jgi:hypothetical protein